MQLASVTDERDRLKNVIDELKKQHNTEGGTEIAGGTFVQVVKLKHHSCST